jgi:hypothetical protein
MFRGPNFAPFLGFPSSKKKKKNILYLGGEHGVRLSKGREKKKRSEKGKGKKE